jgi:hypothetical protein
MGCCAGVFLLAGAPRVALVLLWIFDNDRLSLAFNSFLVGLLGFVFLPYTAVFYALAYAPIKGVSGLGWFFVILGFIIDIGSYTSGGYAQRRRTTV